MLDLIEEQLRPEFGSYEMISATSSKAGELQSKTRPNTPAYWVFLLALVVSMYLFWDWGMVASRFGRGTTIGMVLFVFVPCIVGPFCRALGRNIAAAACAGVAIGSYWTVTFWLLFLYTRESVAGLIWVADLFLPVVFVALATTASMSKRLGPSWGLGTVGIGFLSGAIWAGAVVAAKEAARSHPIGADPRVLGSDLMTINKCSQDFARSNPEKGYPEVLAQLGPQGSGCVPEALLAGQVKGFTITYEPGAKDGNGKIGGYKVVAGETAPVVKDIGSIFTDESGLVRIHFDGLTSDLPSPSTSLGPLLYCVREIASGPVGISGVPAEGDEVIRTCLGSAVAGKRTLRVGGYDFEYKFNAGKNGKITGFTVEARPKPYGAAGVRSYLAVETGDLTVSGYAAKTLNIYATPEDRPATVKDPLVRASEVGLGGYLGVARLCNDPLAVSGDDVGWRCAGDTTHSDSADKK